MATPSHTPMDQSHILIGVEEIDRGDEGEGKDVQVGMEEGG
jgi:hypothetical protein